MIDRPVGALVSNWTTSPAPKHMTLEGRYCRLEPLNAEKHAALLFKAFEGQDHLYDYLPAGPFHSATQYHRWVNEVTADESNLFFVVYDTAKQAYWGVLSYLRIAPAAGWARLARGAGANGGLRVAYRGVPGTRPSDLLRRIAGLPWLLAWNRETAGQRGRCWTWDDAMIAAVGDCPVPVQGPA